MIPFLMPLFTKGSGSHSEAADFTLQPGSPGIGKEANVSLHYCPVNFKSC